MRVEKLDNMVGGWFVGGFRPTLYETTDAEVAVKKYIAGSREAWHFHKVATEITVIISGTVEMNGQTYEAGDMIVIEPGEGTDFHAVTDATNVVVKVPGALNDKYAQDVFAAYKAEVAANA